MSKILIIKTSSLGDILQSFYVLPFLKEAGLEIHFVVDYQYEELATAHPYIDKVISSDFSGWLLKKKKNIPFLFFKRELQKENYDMVFDLQRNWKSSLVLFFTRATKKIGYGRDSVREKVNLLFTNEKYDIPKSQNIRLFYLAIFQKVFPSLKEGKKEVVFHLTKSKQSYINDKKLLFSSIKENKILVSLGSTWKNKMLSPDFIKEFLKKIERSFPVYFFFSYGTIEEKNLCLEIAESLINTHVVEKVSLVLWQPIIREMDMVIATDSSILSLTDMTDTPSFSFFGPTNSGVFSPLKKTRSVQGICPYKQTFQKQCPKLRTCPTGACLKDLEVEFCFSKFYQWGKKHLKKMPVLI